MATYFGFQPYTGDEPFVFISYKSEESETVAKYARYLHDNGINVYYDAALRPGAQWQTELLDTIARENCMGVVLFVSGASLDSQPVEDEAAKAHYSKKSILGVYMENVTPEKAMATFLMKTHDVKAWMMDERKAMNAVLEGARNIIKGGVEPAKLKTDIDELLSNARVFEMNFSRSRSSADAQKAADYYRQAADRAPSDYRGWLGLAQCELMPKPEDIDQGTDCLKRAADHYSYVVALGCDSSATGEYTRAKSRYWDCLIELFEREKNECENLSEAKKLSEQAELAGKRMGHTYEQTRSRFEDFRTALAEKTAELECAQHEKEAARYRFKQNKDGTLTLIKCLSCEKVMNIPAEADGRAVTAVGKKAFYRCADIESIILPHSIKVIGRAAFMRCKALAQLTIPNGAAKIAAKAFAKCPKPVVYCPEKSRVRRYCRRRRIKCLCLPAQSEE